MVNAAKANAVSKLDYLSFLQRLFNLNTLKDSCNKGLASIPRFDFTNVKIYNSKGAKNECMGVLQAALTGTQYSRQQGFLSRFVLLL